MKDIKQEILASGWAKLTLAQADEGELFEDGELAAAKILNETVKLQSLKETDFLYLDGATHANGEEMSILAAISRDYVVCYKVHSGLFGVVRKGDLFLNGKNYKIVEDTETVSQHENVGDDRPEHPETLCSEENYQGAPIGTIVAADNKNVYLKTGDFSWSIAGVGNLDAEPLYGRLRKVLRWGWKS